MKKEIASLFIRIGDDDNKRDWEASKRKKKQKKRKVTILLLLVLILIYVLIIEHPYGTINYTYVFIILYK